MKPPKSRAKHRLVIAFLSLGIALFLCGCVSRPPVCYPEPSCQLTVPLPGTYTVTYRDADGFEQTAQVESLGGVLFVCNCRELVGEPTPDFSARADLSVSIADSPDPASVGNTLTYNIVVRNDGPFEATGGATLIDTLPPELNFVSVSSTRGSCSYAPSSRELTCDLDTLLNDSFAEVTLITEVAFPPLGAETRNAATISLKLGDVIDDPNPDNNTATATTTVIDPNGPDVTVSDSPDPVSVGSNLTYTITLTNNRPESIFVPLFVDTLPAGVTFVSGPQYPCFVEGGTFKCIDLELAAGASVIYQFVVIPTTPGTVTNTLLLPGQLPITNTTTVTEAGAADLGVTISDSPDPVDAENLTYVITVTNHGPEASTGGTLTDLLPPGVDLFAKPAGCSQSGRVITCALGALANGESSTIEIVVTPTVAGTITNTIVMSGNEFDPNQANNEAVATTTVIHPAPSADLAVTISDSPDPVVAEQTLTYNITVTNNGLATATGVTLHATLPSGVNFSGHANCHLGDANSITCNLGELANRASHTLTLAVTPMASGTITNTVRVSALQIDPNTTNNTATETTTVSEPAPTADLSVTISDSPDPVVVDQQLTYNITVTNNGLATATDILLTDTLPPGVSLITSPNCRLESNNTVACIPFSLPNGASGTFTIVVAPTAAGTITNTVNVTAFESDPNTANNTATENTSVTESAPAVDLSLTMSDSPDPVLVNNPLSYAITVTNNGPGTATGITLTDTLPAGVSFIPSPDCQLVGTNTVVCASASLPNGVSTTFTIGVTPTTAGTIINTASVTAVEPDPNTNNNTVTETTTVERQPADLSVTISDAPDPVFVNQQFIYGITVANHGPGPATNIIVTDTLPPGVSYIANPGCHLAGNTVTCGPVSLPNGDSRTFAIAVVPTITGTINNTAAVTALETDLNPANNTVTETTTVESPPAADLSVVINSSPDPVFADEQLTYTITVTNNGPDMATGVTLTDTLPANVSFIASPDCQLVGNMVTCTPVSLASGASTTFTISVTPTIEGTVTNTVSVAGLVSDPNLTNNTATATTTVLPSAQLVVSITDSPDPAPFGGAVTYTVTVTNHGPSTATNVVLVNSPAPLEIDDSAIVLSQGSFTRTRRPFEITCNFGTLASGASATATITGFNFSHGTITWTATVTANEHDPNPANNTAAESTLVN